MCSVGDPLHVSSWGGGRYDPLHLFGNPALDAANAAQARAEQEREARIQRVEGRINNYFDSPGLKAEYAKYGTDMFNLLKSSLDQNTANESRGLKFSMSRSGNIGGSQDVYDHGLLQKDYNTGLLNAKNQASGAQAGLESADNATRNALDSMALSGMSSTDAMTQALNQSRTNLTAAQGNIVPEAADSLFGDLASATAQRQANAGVQAANAAAAGQGQAGGLGSYFDYTPPQQSLDPFAEDANPSGVA